MMMMMNQMMNQSFTDFTNLAILRYVGASPQSPSNDPTVNIPMSMLPLNEKDLHVCYMYLFFPYEANNLTV
jgi:hypothetical protein